MGVLWSIELNVGVMQVCGNWAVVVGLGKVITVVT